VSGAVSLGSYEAGVLYEVLYAIGQHNQSPDTSADDKIYIDVLTGASAGGMSVALAAQKLLHDADALNDPYNNTLYQAWVVDIDIDQLLALEPQEPSDASLFSSDLIMNLANGYLRSRYQNGSVPPSKTHPAVSPAKSLKLGLALSNLNGIDYGRRTLTGGDFIYSRFADEYRRTLTLNDDNEASWRPVAQAAVACGAFPFAFRPQDLSRQRSEFTDADIILENLGRDPLTFTYTDGGLFQNEPLGLAKEFVDELDCHLNSDTRAYLFISPDPKASNVNHGFSASRANFRGMLTTLAPNILYQSRFQDWIRAEKVNEQVDTFNGRALQLHHLMQLRIVTPESVNPASAILLQQLFPSEPDRNAARSQIRNQFQVEFRDLQDKADLQTAEAWLDAILVLETAADLHDKDEMYIYTVTASSDELAGAQLEAFLGFLDRSFREHDYDIGRTKAQEFLTRTVATCKGPLPVLRYTPQPVRPINTKLAGAKIANAPLEKRKALRSRLQNRADIMLKEAGVPLPLRAPIRWCYLNGKINQFLGL
jgi:predicted acylesterase/phospholipase RssA